LELIILAFSINDCLGTYISNMSAPATQIPVKLSSAYTTKTFYVNYPEKTSAGSFPYCTAEKKYYLNRQDFTGSGNPNFIFYSLQNTQGLGNINFGIRIYNPATNSSDLTVTIYHHGHYAYNGSNPSLVAGEPWKQYFSNAGKQVIVPRGEFRWIHNYAILANQWFSGVTEYTAKTTTAGQPYTMAAYFYSGSLDNPTIPDDCGPYPIYVPSDSPQPNDPRYYSGVMDGFFLETTETITIRANELAATGGLCMKMNDIEFPPNVLTVNKVVNSSSDLVSINQVINQAGTTKTYSAPTANLGNWGYRRNMSISFYNDTNTGRFMYGYVRANLTGGASYPVLYCSNSVKYGRLHSGESQGTWNWFSRWFNAYEQLTDVITFINGTNSSRSQSMFFKL
jgi:hypothetical protein